MSSCLSGGGRTYGFDLEIVKSPSTSTQTLVTTTSSSSPSSTISESSNSPLTISTRKPRTPRKRPNQTYNEAAALLSTAYPNVFSTKHFSKNPCKFTKPQDNFFDESSELLLPFRVVNDDLGIIIPFHHHQLEKPSFRFESKSSNSIEKSCQSPIEIDSHSNFGDGYQYNHHHHHQQQQQQQQHQDDDFDAESILDEEIEEGGIDSIMGNLSVNNDSSSSIDESNASSYYPMGLGFGGNFEFGFGFRLGVRAFRPVVDEGDWWRFPAIDVREISPKFNTTTKVSVKKKKKKVEKSLSELPKESSILAGKPPPNSELLAEKPIPKPDSGLLLKLNFDKVLNAWSDRGSPFSDDIQGSELPGTGDAHARLAQIDLFPENGGAREACVLRYKEKRRTRLFSKKIRYQVRKVNADRRPRMKGRFVRRPNSNGSSLMKK